MKTVAFVPIKMNNERLPGKNTKAFSNGGSLISYILETLKQINGVDEIYVYCSNPVIQKFIPEGVKCLQRDEYLYKPTTSFNEVLKYFVRDVKADIYLLTLWKDGNPFNYNPSSIPEIQDLEPYFTETRGMYIYISDLIKNVRLL